MNVMLLAAGEGSRLRPYTFLRPKPAIPFMNIPLAAYPLAFLENVSIDNLVVNTFHLPTKVVDLFVHLKHGAKQLHFSHEIEKLLGNGGGLGYAREHFAGQGDLIMMNSDEVIVPFEPGHMAKAIAAHKASGAICTLITMDHPGVGTQFGGVWLNEAGDVKGFGKIAPNPDCKTAEHFIGVQILSDQIFQFLPNGDVSNILYDGVARALEAGHKVRRHKIQCHWYETGNPKDFLHATVDCLRLLSNSNASDLARMHLEKAITHFAGEKPSVVKTENLILLQHSTAKVESTVGLSGFAVLGAGAKVGKNCQLKNVVIADNTEVPHDTHAENEIFL